MFQDPTNPLSVPPPRYLLESDSSDEEGAGVYPSAGPSKANKVAPAQQVTISHIIPVKKYSHVIIGVGQAGRYAARKAGINLRDGDGVCCEISLGDRTLGRGHLATDTLLIVVEDEKGETPFAVADKVLSTFPATSWTLVSTYLPATYIPLPQSTPPAAPPVRSLLLSPQDALPPNVELYTSPNWLTGIAGAFISLASHPASPTTQIPFKTVLLPLPLSSLSSTSFTSALPDTKISWTKSKWSEDDDEPFEMPGTIDETRKQICTWVSPQIERSGLSILVTDMRDYTDSLHQSLDISNALLAQVRSFSQSALTYKAPVIDGQHSRLWRQDEIAGYKRFVEILETTLVSLRHMMDSGLPPKEDPLPSAVGQVTFFKCMLRAKTPIPAIKASIKGKGKEDAFVDIVAQGGEEWIKVYSKKVNQLLAEFREQDSYVDFSDEEDDADGSGPGLTNSMIQMVDNLLSVARDCEVLPGRALPRLTLRITRIPQFPGEEGWEDPRIPATFDAIRARGVKILFGDLAEVSVEQLIAEKMTIHRVERELLPTTKVNLDPTALMGLCSDLLHHPLTATADEARQRFYRPPHLLMDGYQGRGEVEDENTGQSQNSRELVKGLKEEMEQALVEEIRDVLERACEGEPVEFWTTREAVKYVSETISGDYMVGEGLEQRRMRRLIGLEEGNFFEGSRYEGSEGCLRNLKVHVFAEMVPERLPMCLASKSSFHLCLASITALFLSEYYRSLRDPAPEPAIDLPSFLQPKRLPQPKIAQLSVPFTVVSLHSLYRGAHEGMTTLVMGNVVFREIWNQPRWKIRGWNPGNEDIEAVSAAAMWIVPYRSLGEGKRVKFENGDYSYPKR
ncbi:hypothetical protein P7C73_g4731, partial [Tremellales sp. Uapishka_1]